ncbi:hypothetical protein A500_09078 [Clostridium sartagoforme AAU1]|uniref:Uncharacterized protein n=3 Tax=Clostridium TaxID=1485 RepID=R9CA19_9CLOT|nr:hypothetical protein [Clostridium sartagoforme]EOR26128.1 hypothetical protein A500_09078 [Clostridium sartagoforme AAU1]
MAIIDTMINSKIFTRGKYNALKLVLLSILIYVLSIVLLMLLTNFTYSILLVIVLTWLIFIFLLGDIIIKKW